MIFEDQDELKRRAEEITGRKIYSRHLKVIEDTSNYIDITGHSVLRLAGMDYFVMGDATEGRFGISDQPKLWVKYAVDLTSGQRKIIKLVFEEQFQTTLGSFTVRCKRSAEKEGRVLQVVAGDERFMQGTTVRDVQGNPVRVIDRIEGQTIFNIIAAIDQSHEEYYHRSLPSILRKLVGSIEAMAFLHRHGLQHGDIRNDHIFQESSTGRYRWIDFDYTVNFADYDIWSMGNILTFAVGKGIITCRDALRAGSSCGAAVAIAPDDALLLTRYRLANLRKLFPYIHPLLNELLMRFSAGTTDYFLDFDEMAKELRSVLDQMNI